MHYGNIKKYDIANGQGVRTTLFVSGCTNHCFNCFQPQTWNFEYGDLFTKEVEDDIIESLKPSYVEGLTVLGGEPMEFQNQRDLLPFLKRVKEIYPDKNIWCFTGFILDQDLLEGGKRYCEVTNELLSFIDILVDGPFIQDQYDISLAFRGSKNQRIIDLQKSLQEKEVVLYME